MKQELTKEQERRRLKGLRILARIIVRHRLAHPELYANGVSGEGLLQLPGAVWLTARRRPERRRREDEA